MSVAYDDFAAAVTADEDAGDVDAVANLLARFFVDAGYPPTAIGADQRWDLLVTHEEVQVAAFVLRWVGLPVGSSDNDRTEKAIASAVDLRKSALQGTRPWLGYVCLARDGGHRSDPQSFVGFCEWIATGGLFDAVCFASWSPETSALAEPVRALDWRRFIAAIHARITYLAGLGVPDHDRAMLRSANP